MLKKQSKLYILASLVIIFLWILFYVKSILQLDIDIIQILFYSITYWLLIFGIIIFIKYIYKPVILPMILWFLKYIYKPVIEPLIKPSLIILVALLPLHALLITTLKCKFWFNTDIVRFWKEIILAILFIITFIITLSKYSWNFSRLYKNNYLLGTITAFALCSFAFIFLPYLQPKLSSYLWFKYDVFFLVAFVIWLYLVQVKQHFSLLLKTLFWVIWWILIIFLPWYLFGDISTVSGIFGFSKEVSTYSADTCISFSQNVNGQHRFQGSFSGPIRWSVFLTVFYLLYLWYILKFLRNTKNNIFVLKWKPKIGTTKYTDISKALIVIPSLLVITSIFFSYSKTSILWLFVGITLFLYLTFKIKYKKKLSVKYITIAWIITLIPIVGIAILKKDLFLHLWAILNRLDNLKMSVEMFVYNPIWYGLGIAGPASWVGKSIESAGWIDIAIASTAVTLRFLPENWYVQILLEQWIIWLALFVWVIIVIWLKLYSIVKKQRNFLSIWFFSAYITLLFMANFTHAFEESATSYIFFLLMWAYIAQNNLIKRHKTKKKK